MADEKEVKEKLIGKVTHYYSNIQVGIIKLEKGLKIGDSLHIKGNTTDFEQEVESMQYGHEKIEKGKAGQEVGIGVKEKVRDGDQVFKK